MAGMATASVHRRTSDVSQYEHPVHVDHDRMAAHDLFIMVAIPNLIAALERSNFFEALAQAGDGAPLKARAVNVPLLERALPTMGTHKVLCEIVTTRVDDGRVERRYALAPIGKFFVENETGGDKANLLLTIHEPVYRRPWEHVHGSILDGSLYPIARAQGGFNVWKYFEQHPPLDKVFQKGMSGMRSEILDVYRGFDDVKVLVDVRVNIGTAVSLITAQYPHMKGINFDQPSVIATCPNLPGN